MERYISKSAILAEIEREIEFGKLKVQQSQENNDYISNVAWSEHIASYGKMLSFLNTLEVKEVDFEKELNDYGYHYDYVSLAGRKELMDFAKHFFELGLRA